MKRSVYPVVKRATILLALAGTLSGCAHTLPDGYDRFGYQQPLESRIETLNLKSFFDAVALELSSDACCGSENPSNCGSTSGASSVCGCPGEKVIVPDFVDLQSFKPKSAGLTMAELMRGSLSRTCGNTVIQGEFSKYFKVSDEGLVILSRSPNDLVQEYRGRYVVVGTYEYKRNKLLVFVKKINARDDQIVRMVTKEIDFVPGGNSETYLIR